MQTHQTSEQIAADAADIAADAADNRFQLAVYHAAHKGAMIGAIDATVCLGLLGFAVYCVADIVRGILAARKGS